MTTTATTADQFARFVTDAGILSSLRKSRSSANIFQVGLERMLRLGESVALMLVSFPLALAGVIGALSFTTSTPLPKAEHVRSIASELQLRFGLGRRFFRMLRWFDCFRSAHVLYLRLSQDQHLQTKPTGRTSFASFCVEVQPWVDLLGRTCNAMWFLLDASTLVDALRIEGLRLLGPTLQQATTIEAQRFWLFALVCGVLSGLLKISVLVLEAPARSDTDGTNTDEAFTSSGANDKATELNSVGGKAQKAKELRAIYEQELKAVSRTVIANALDIIIPGKIIGWIRVKSGIVGIAMFITTILTGADAWERCGREVANM